MKLRHIVPAAMLLLLSATAIVIFSIATAQLQPKEMSEWNRVPMYNYLSPYVELSPYDRHFREAADSIGYDWTLIAAIAYTESRFDSTAVSGAGALGVMQVMPRTLRGYNIPDSLHADSYTNIMAAARLLHSLEKFFKYITPPAERIKFVLASYNAGYGHILDAMRLAHKYGHNKYVWENSVDSFLIHKSDPQYYTDILCRNGRFSGWKETLSFVKKVHRKWTEFDRAQKHYSDSIKIVIANDTLTKIKTGF